MTENSDGMQNPLVSVVMPVYNGAAFLAEAIESVLGQTHASVELIVVDDGSTDASPQIIGRHGERLVAIRQNNAGVAAARNAGIAAARGEFVAFLDQDDWWLPEKLLKQLVLFQRDARVGLTYTAVTFYDDRVGRLVPDPYPDVRRQILSGNCYEPLLLNNPIVNSSVAVRRGVLLAVGGCDTHLAGNTVQDYDLWLRVAKVCRFAHLPDPLTIYRLHGDQGCHDHVAMFRETLGVLLKHRPEAEWLRCGAGRRRLAELYDALATAYFDRGDTALARRHFAKAFALCASTRNAIRIAASCVPRAFAVAFQRMSQRVRR